MSIISATGVGGIGGVQEVFELCFAELRQGARPMSVDSQATAELQQMLQDQFARLTGEGRWQKDGDEVLRQAWHVGAIARLIASSGGRSSVDSPTVKKALEVVNEQCRLGAVGDKGIKRIWCTP